MDGIIVVDKPAGWTSHDVVAKLRGVLGEKRIGHGGTLDPMATGVLPVFVGRATLACQFCESAEKEYVAGLLPGIVTDTQDTTGATLSASGIEVTTQELEAAIPRFIGRISQIPPMYSAIKRDGKKLYELARRGIEVERPARDIFIYAIEPLGREGSAFLLRIACSKGTYIRTLCHDIGQALGCGAAMCSLRRTKAGSFDIGMSHSLEEIQAAAGAGAMAGILLGTDRIFAEYPPVTLGGEDTAKCKNGAPCVVDGIPGGTYRFYGPNGEFLLLGEVSGARGGRLEVIKRFFVR